MPPMERWKEWVRAAEVRALVVGLKRLERQLAKANAATPRLSTIALERRIEAARKRLRELRARP